MAEPNEGRDLFTDWAELNFVICPWRSRFDDLRTLLSGCRTQEAAADVLVEQGFDRRYPLLPDWLPSAGEVRHG